MEWIEIYLNHICMSGPPMPVKPGVDPASVLPEELMLQIFSFLSVGELARCQLVDRTWSRIAGDDHLKPDILPEIKKLEQRGFLFFKKGLLFLGEDVWTKYLGDVGCVPPITREHLSFLQGPCPWTEGKRAWETHVFYLVPPTVNGKPITINSIEKLVESPKNGGNAGKYIIWDLIRKVYGKKVIITKPYWAAILQTMPEESMGKTREEQMDLAESKPGYRTPTLLEAIIQKVLLYVSRGKGLFGDNPWPYTCCQEMIGNCKLVVGGFSASSLWVQYDYDYSNVGVAPLRKF